MYFSSILSLHLPICFIMTNIMNFLFVKSSDWHPSWKYLSKFLNCLHCSLKSRFIYLSFFRWISWSFTFTVWCINYFRHSRCFFSRVSGRLSFIFLRLHPGELYLFWSELFVHFFLLITVISVSRVSIFFYYFIIFIFFWLCIEFTCKFYS